MPDRSFPTIASSDDSAIAASRDHLPQQPFDAGHRLVLLTRRQEKSNGRISERSEKYFAPKRPDFRRREHKDSARYAARYALNARRKRPQQAAAGIDVVFGGRSLYANGLHASFILKDLDYALC